MNKTILIGRITKDMDLFKTNSGTSVVNFTLAVNKKFKSENQPNADFIRCVAWGKTAEIMSQYLNKGSQIGIEGRIETSNYEKDGQTIFKTEVVVENFDFLEKKNEEQKETIEANDAIAVDSDDLPF